MIHRAAGLAAVLLPAFAAACRHTPPPLPAQELLLPPAMDLAHCRAAARTAGQRVQPYACAGTDLSARVRFSAGLPAGWDVGEEEGRDIAISATRGDPGVFIRGGDQLPEPLTASDTADFWNVATELVQGRVPTPREVAEFRRDAGDEEGGRFMVTRAQMADSALLHLASRLSAEAGGTPVRDRVLEVRTLGGRRAGYLAETVEREGVAWRTAAWVTVADAVFFGMLITAPEADFATYVALWSDVHAAFAIPGAAR